MAWKCEAKNLQACIAEQSFFSESTLPPWLSFIIHPLYFKLVHTQAALACLKATT